MAKPTVISLFTGAGGLDLGFHAAGLRTAVAVEMDKRCCETLEANKSETHPWHVIHAAIEDVPSSEILKRGRLDVGEAEVLIGGPPCQPFSKNGYWARGDSGRLADPRANTLAEYFRVVEECRPKTFLLENVSGLAYSGKEEGFDFIHSEIERINAKHKTRYNIETQLLNAADYGVPQTRERLIVVGDILGRSFKFPEPRFYDADRQRPGEEHAGLEPYRTAWDALGDEVPIDLDDTRPMGKWGDLLPSVPEGLNYLHFTDVGESTHKFWGPRTRYWSFLLKLAKQRPSWTLTASPGPAIGPFHWEGRRLSRRELMRLQTFPESYTVTGTLRDVQKQVGNAVPSLLAEVLATEIRRQLLGHRVARKQPMLLPARREQATAREQGAPVPGKYHHLHGQHAAHPGTRLGPRALSMAAE